MPQQHIGNNSYAYTLQQPIIAHGHNPSDTHYQTFKESTGQ